MWPEQAGTAAPAGWPVTASALISQGLQGWLADTVNSIPKCKVATSFSRMYSVPGLGVERKNEKQKEEVVLQEGVRA